MKAFASEVLFNWQFGYVLLPLGVIAAVVARRDPEHSPPRNLLLVFAGFWLAVTHLQSRFFVLAVPVAALLVAGIDWGRRAWVGASGRRRRGGRGARLDAPAPSTSRMDGPRGLSNILGVPGDAFVQLYPPELHNIPADAPLTLVGEAKAFLYPRKMGMLRYRTVFDVDRTSAMNLVDAWRGQPIPNEWLLVDPVELERFSQTYFGIPAPPAEVRARTGPYVVPADGESRGAPGSAPPR